MLTKPLSPDLLAHFAAIVGDKYAVTDQRALEPHLVEQRGLYHGNTPLMLRPGSVADVQAVLKLANDTKTPIVAQGGNTGLVGGQIPHHGEVILSLTRLNKIREIDAASNTITCESGVVLAAAQDAAAKAGRLFPLSLGAEGSCTIGGNLSTNAGGTAAIVYGTARDLVLGLEVVLADGRVISGLNKLKKDNTGYDLRNIFIGAEGTLGIITAAVLKMFPRPRSVETAFIGLSSPQAALDLLNLAQERFGNTITSFELLARIALEMTVKHGANVRDPLGSAHDWYVLMEISSQASEGVHEQLEDLLAEGIERGIVSDAAIAANLEQAKAFWHLRLEMSDAQKPEGGSIKHDVSVPISAVPAFLAEAGETVLKLIPGARLVPFGHLGDGNIHYNVSQPLGADKATFLARWHEVNDAVHAIVARYRGSISAEHGIGVLKRDLLPHVKDAVALDVMKNLKRSFDPNNILNPGKVL
jgi:D-lactate dehydrogenase (cytochrome)